jgi:hypothetical protein
VKRNEVIGGQTSFCNEELNSLFPISRVARVMKSQSVRWADKYMVDMAETRIEYRVLFAVPERDVRTRENGTQIL